MKISLSLLTLANLSPSFGAGWVYPYKVNNWQEAADVCGSGSAQSPVDLTTTSKRQRNKLEFRTGEAAPTNLKVYGGHSVGGHGLGFAVEPGHQLFIPKQDVMYDLLQMHFHTGSEHTVDGKQFVAELHYVHSRAGVPVDPYNGDLAVVGVFFELWDGKGETPESVDVLDNLLSAVGFTEDALLNWSDEGKKHITLAFKVEIFEELTTNDAYWTYSGSLTTPPCSEIVSWHVMMTPLKITQAQVDLIESISGNAENFRPPMPLNGRRIKPKLIAECGVPDMKVHSNEQGRDSVILNHMENECACEEACSAMEWTVAWSFKHYGKASGKCVCHKYGSLKKKSKGENRKRSIISGMIYH